MSFFNQNIKLLRAKYKLTQPQVAEKLGVKYKTYQAWEAGRGEPPYETIAAISNLYQVTFDDLVRKDISQTDQTQEHWLIIRYNLAPDNIKNAIDKLLMV